MIEKMSQEMNDKQKRENAFEVLIRNAMEQNEKKRKRIFLEIGTGQVPVALLPDGRKFDPQTEEYIGIDIDPQNVESNRDALNILEGVSDNIFFEIWEGQKINLPDKTVDEIFMGNVIGEQRISRVDIKNMIKEVNRVLRDDGKLIIKETYSPPYQDEVESLFAESGFKIRIIPLVGEEFQDLFKKYNLRENPSQYAYFLIASK